MVSVWPQRDTVARTITDVYQPPKRRAASGKYALPAKRPSKLAKENGITADQEAEIRDAFALFAVKHPEHDSKEGVLRREDVRRCLMYVCANLIYIAFS
jgi:hypothetical protein